MYQERPTGITIIAILFFITGVMAILGGLYTLAAPVPSLWPILSSYQITISIIGIIIGGIEIAIGWGLWTLQDWGRIGAIILLALSAISNLFAGVGFLAGVNIAGYTLSLPGPGIASLLITGLEAWAIWYLLKPEIEGQFKSGSVGYIPPTRQQPQPQPQPPRQTPPPPPTPDPQPKRTVPQQSPKPQAPSPRPPRRKTQPISPPSSPEGWLVLRSGSRSGQQFGLKRGRNTVGRDPDRSDIVLEDDTVSGEHARIQLEQGQFYIYDLASTNGTFVNNHRVQKEMLMDNDVVRFGNAEMVFKRV